MIEVFEMNQTAKKTESGLGRRLSIKKRFFVGLVAGTFSLSLLTGCGKSDNPVEQMKERYSQYVDLGDYMGIEYTPTETEVKDTDVDSELAAWVRNYGETVHKTTGVAAIGDKVGIDYTGRIDGVAFDKGSTNGAGTEITLGSSGYIDNFDEQIAGHEPGQTFDVTVTFPETYGDEALNGKEAVFETTLNYIVGTEYPEITDELVSEKTDYKTVEEFRKQVEKDLVKETAENDLATDKEAMMKQITETSAVKQYPEQEMKDQIEMLTNQVKSVAESYGVSLDQYLMYFGYDADSFQESLRTSVESNVQRKMIVVSIAKKEDITVTKAESEAKIQELLKASGLSDVATLSSRYGYSDDDYYYVVLEEKVLDFIYNNATPKVKGSSTEEQTSGETGSDTSSETTEAASTEAASEN
jgi:trigger factor